MPMGKHYGAFAGGFAKSFTEMMKLYLMQQHYDALNKHYAAQEELWANRGVGKGKGLTPEERAAGAAAGADWDKGGGAGGGASTAKIDPNAASIVAKELTDRGVKPEVAAGAVAGMMGESGAKLDPTAFNSKDPHGGAGGIAQWNNERLIGPNGMLAYAKSKGIDVNPNVPTDAKKVPLQVQADFLGHELDTSHNGVLKGLQVANSGEEGLTTWVNNYEVPADKAGAIAQRRQYIAPVTATLRNPPKTTTTAAATTPTKGPNKGKAPATKTADEPTKSAQAVEADTAAPEGGFRLPGDTRTPADATHVFTPDELGGEAQVSGRGPTEDPAAAGAGSPPREPASLPITPLSPRTQALSDAANYPPSTDYPQPGPGVPAAPAPTQLGPESPYMPPDKSVYTGATASEPSGTNFVRPTGSPMGPPAPPAGTEPSGTQFVRPAPPAAPRMPPRTTTPATAYPAGTIYGPNPRADTGARPDLTARSPETGIPSTATASVPPTNPAGNSSRFVTIDRPNADPTQRNRGSPQGTALDLSHLWGPNPPLAQQAPAPAPTPRPQDQDNSMVGSANMDDAALGVDIMGSAKGGPIGAIPTRPIMKLAGAGPVTEPYVNQTSAVPGYTYNPGYSSGANLRMEQNQALYGSATPAASADFGAAWGKLTPAQQNWYTQSAVAGDYNQANANPYPATPTSAPAPAAAAPAPAPAPVITPPTATNITAPAATTTITDPTTTTTTGAPGLPNSIQAKSYDPNVDQQTGAGFTNTSNAGGTDYSVGTDDLLKQNNQGQISGSRKGGPIERFVKGGGIPSRPMMKFAAGGGAAASTLLSPSYSGPKPGGGWAGTAYADMAPNQQAWADQQQTLLGQEKANANNPAWSGWSQLSGTPAAIWPTAAPTAPTPLNEPAPAATTTVAPSASSTITDPTTTTTTGAPGLPNSIQAKSYDPNVDQQTGAGFANTSNTGGTDYSVGTDDLLQQNSQGQISGSKQNTNTVLSRKGGPIHSSGAAANTRRSVGVTQRVKFDDGGGVSPSAAGMPPGMGGQQAIPPIYFNPATYAGAGAPVGKGITQNSATTFNAGAIPSLPMARGGVVGYDDGGGVGDLDTSLEDERGVASDDAMTNQLLAQNDQTDAASGAGGYFTPSDYTAPAAPAPTSGSSASQGGPPSGVSQITPEISDGQGNPSKGLIGAIGDGLHWLGDHLGLVGGAQAHPAIASHPDTQTNRANFASGQNVGGMDKATHDDLANTIDPNNSLNGAERQIAVMEGTYRYMLSQGNATGAAKMAASILQYSVQTSQKFAEEAAKQLYDGNLQGAVDNINHASDAVPDGRLTHVTLNKDGTAIVTSTGMDGRVLWQQKGSAEAILQYATNRGRTGQMQWDALEDQAAKYDPTFRDMKKARNQNITAQTKADAAEASANKVAAAGGSSTLQPVTRVGNAAPPAIPSGPTGTPASATAPAAPTAPASPEAPTTASAAGAAPTPDSTGAAAPNAAPATADSNASPYPPSPLGGAASAQPGPVGIPSRPTTEQPANAPAPAAQDVSFEDVAARINSQETQTNSSDLQKIQGRYFTPQGNILYGGQEYARPPEPNLQGLNPAEQRQALQAYAQGPLAQYNAMLKANQDAMNKEVSENRDIRSKQFQTLRDRAREQFSEQGRRETSEQQDTRAAQRAVDQSKRDAVLNQQKDALDKSNAVFKSNLAGSAPRSDQEMNSLAGEGKTYDPVLEVAKAFNPDLAANGEPSRAVAMNDLKQKGFDANTQATLATAWHNAVRNSHGVDPEQIGPAIQSFVTSGPFTATAEQTDANGRPAPMHGEVRYVVTVEDNTGNHISMLMPQTDLANLRNLRYQYSRQQGINLGNTISQKGVLGALGVGQPGLPPTSVERWQQRTPAEMTQQPPW